MDLLLKNCKLIDKKGEFYIGIDNGKISKISKLPQEADKIIDINNNIVLPGLIDPHVHFRDPGMTNKEDIKTGSMAAANGGFTTVIDMPNTKPKTNTLKAYKEKEKLIKNKSIINTLIHAGINNFDEMNKIAKLNPISFKIFMNEYDDIELDEIFKNISKLDTNPLVTIHGEDKKIIEENTKKMKEKGTNLPIDHAYARPSTAEDVAIEKAIKLSKKYNLKLHVCHLSSRKSEEIIKNNISDVDISYEFTPHHLLLEANSFNKFGNIVKTNPPLRFYGENITINALNENSIIGTDHAPHTVEEKENMIWNCPSGMPNIETVLSLILTEVNRKNIPLNIVPKILSENAAKRFNLKNKGKIKENYDGDLTIIDLKKEGTFNLDEFYTKAKFSPFANIPYKGQAVMTIYDGKVKMDNNIIIE
ncbi:dihydroorotase [Methanobrevibacter sp. 87.7]|uniref:dihydroorotase n=1 Tax=Methanobrevibacter sp. 87.7 TaxID=387957 RepID=UPI000B512B3B|nr:dihydroorotase family protein [Methanobrevibacter sp. 87.7]OWT32556.1 dihydroorotase [Methanobrevibacter sp. 87.7]